MAEASPAHAIAPALHHVIDGRGPRIVLLHPVGLDLTFLDPVAAELRQSFSVLRIDQRGHGGTPVGPPMRSLEDYADDVHELLHAIDFAPAAVIGFSFGGMIAQTLALRQPADVSALMICACPSTLPPAGREIAAQRGSDARRDGMAAVLEATLDRWFTPQFRADGRADATRAHLLAHDPEGWAQAWDAISGVDTAPRLGEIRVPTLCVAGERDKSSPPEIVKAIADAIPGARYTVMGGAPHMLFMEQPREFARIARDFLRAVA
jgi:3-oxoadipate enol-lactonase